MFGRLRPEGLWLWHYRLVIHNKHGKVHWRNISHALARRVLMARPNLIGIRGALFMNVGLEQVLMLYRCYR